MYPLFTLPDIAQAIPDEKSCHFRPQTMGKTQRDLKRGGGGYLAAVEYCI